jgi:hypothetical protein
VSSAVDPAVPAKIDALQPWQLRLFVRNVVALSVVGVAISIWLLLYTDLFPAIGGLLGLGGVLAWIAFLTNLIRKERKEQIQAEIENRVLLARSTIVFAILALVAFAVWAALHGTVVILSPGKGQSRAVELRNGSATIETIQVPAESSTKTLVWTLQGSRDLTVKTDGLPELAVAVGPFGRTKVILPGSFLERPILLARLAPDALAAVKGEKAAVSVSIRDSATGAWRPYGSILEYSGENFWIGAAADVQIPTAVEERWRREFERIKAAFEPSPPRAVESPTPLVPNDQIRVCITAGGTEMAFGEATVLSRKQQVFPQELLLEQLPGTSKCAQ